MNRHCVKSLLLALVLTLPCVGGTSDSANCQTSEVVSIPLPGASPRLDASFGRQPLAFEPNVGQTDAQVEFVSRGPGYQLFLTHTEAVMVLTPPNAREGAGPQSTTLPGDSRPDVPPPGFGVRQPSAALWDGDALGGDREFTELLNAFESGAGAPHSKTLPRGSDALLPVARSADSHSPSVMRMRLVGANDSPPVQGEVERTGKVNYFIGNDPTRWRTNIPTFAKVQYRDVYPGTDLVYYGNQEGRLEYDFVLAPGADPNLIALEFDGADRIELDAQGDLIAWVAGREVRWRKPVVYQEFDGQRIEVAGAYRVDGGSLTYHAKGSHRIGFELAAYDRSQPLVIDPVLVYSTFLGGSGNDSYPYGASSIVSDSQGNAYVVGSTDSLDFPIKNAIQLERAGVGDAFVAKLSPSGELRFSTYLGGSGIAPWATDRANAIALDSEGNIHIAGTTASDDFPVVNALQMEFGGSQDGFVMILNPEGSEIRFSTYWGGTKGAVFDGLALDPVGNIYLSGGTGYDGTAIHDFPVHNALQPQYRGGGDAVVVKLTAGGTGVVYSTYFGGSGGESADRIVADAEGFAYIAGTTWSSNLPVTNAYKPRFTGDMLTAGPPPIYWSDGYFAKITPDGSALSYCSYFGGAGSDVITGLALGPNGDLWLAGRVTEQTSGLATPGAFLTSVPRDSYWTSIVARFNATTGMLEAATYFDRGVPNDIAVDAAGNVWVAGMAFENLPLVDPLQAYSGEVSGQGDGFVAKISADCSRLLFSTYFGGTESDQIDSLCLAPNGDVLLFGQTKSETDFPVLNAFQPQFNGGEADTFIARISMGAVLKMTRSGQSVVFSWPAAATGYHLESAASVGADASWTTVASAPVVIGDEQVLTVDLGNGAQFFRLTKP